MRIPKNHPLSAQQVPEAEPRDLAAERRTVLRQLGIRENVIIPAGADGSPTPALVAAWLPTRREEDPGRPVTRALVLSLPVFPETHPIWDETTYLYRITTGRQSSWRACNVRDDDECEDCADRITAYPVAEYLMWCERGLCVEAWPDHLGRPDVPTLVLHDGAELALQNIARGLGA